MDAVSVAPTSSLTSMVAMRLAFTRTNFVVEGLKPGLGDLEIMGAEVYRVEPVDARFVVLADRRTPVSV